MWRYIGLLMVKKDKIRGINVFVITRREATIQSLLANRTFI